MPSINYKFLEGVFFVDKYALWPESENLLINCHSVIDSEVSDLIAQTRREAEFRLKNLELDIRARIKL